MENHNIVFLIKRVENLQIIVEKLTLQLAGGKGHGQLDDIHHPIYGQHSNPVCEKHPQPMLNQQQQPPVFNQHHQLPVLEQQQQSPMNVQ